MASSLAALPGLPMAAARPLNPSPCVSFSRSGLFGRSLTVTPAPLPTTTTTATLPYPSVFCGRGDRKTAKGKRFNHSFGNARPKNKKKGRGPPRVAVPPAPPRKDKFDDGEIVKIEIDESLFSS